MKWKSSLLGRSNVTMLVNIRFTCLTCTRAILQPPKKWMHKHQRKWPLSKPHIEGDIVKASTCIIFNMVLLLKIAICLSKHCLNESSFIMFSYVVRFWLINMLSSWVILIKLLNIKQYDTKFKILLQNWVVYLFSTFYYLADIRALRDV